MAGLVGLGLLSAAVLLLQVALTRVFSITQFYHFAFLVISLALLGFGASGSLLAVFPRLRKPERGPWYALGFAVSAMLAYLFIDHLPFDSYSIAWDRAQVLLLAANLIALAVPFAFAGALIAALLSADAAHAGRIYSANLIGSALGALLAPLVIGGSGSERTVLLSAILGAGAVLVLRPRGDSPTRSERVLFSGATGFVMLGLLLVVFWPAFMTAQPSPYKRLSTFRLDPDAAIVTTRQNAYSQLNIVASGAIHSAPGASLTYFGALPPQIGLLLDGDNLLPVANASQADPVLGQSLPAAVAYAIRPDANVVVLGSGGNMAPWAALANGARAVTVVEPNELVYEALTEDDLLRAWAGIAGYPNVDIIHQELRPFAQQRTQTFDVVQLALTDAYRPITSGAFTLTENYTLTVEAFTGYLKLAGDDGLLVFNRWLQDPPSESLRALGLVMAALGPDRDPLQHIFAFRSFQTMTFIVKPTPFSEEEVAALLSATADLRYDLVLAPAMPPDAINRYAKLATPAYHDAFLALATTSDPAAFYAAYDFNIAPPTDDRPFFFHFFRWRQTPEVLASLGTRWQPFGGSGYFVLVALLILMLVAALLLVLLPVGLRREFRAGLRMFGMRANLRTLGYFAALGLAYLLVEVALIQQFILLLGQPTLAVAAVIGALLFFSGVGSGLSDRIRGRWPLVLLAGLIGVLPLAVDAITPSLWALPLFGRFLAVASLIALPGLLMGLPFAQGITALHETPDLVPWAWAVNGSTSVISAMLAVMLALSWGFTGVLLVGGGLYLLAAGLKIHP